MADPEISKRIFVKGFSRETTESDLKNFFEEFGSVKESKIVKDKTGASKGYAFITFESQEVADNVREQEVVELNDKRLAIFKAMRRRSARQYGRDYYRDFRHHNRHFSDTNHSATYSTMHDGSVYFGQFGSTVHQPQVVTLVPTAAYQQPIHQFHPNQTTYTPQSATQPAIYMVGATSSPAQYQMQAAATPSPYHSWNDWGMPVNVMPKTVHPTFTSFQDVPHGQEIAMATNLVVTDGSLVPTTIAETANGATVDQYLPLEAKLKTGDKPKTVTAVPVKFLKKVDTTQAPGTATATIHVVTSNGQVTSPQ